jgi:UDP-glucose 4-epimerase
MGDGRAFVRQALTGADVTVYGDGEQRRSFCHVVDTVEALVMLLDHPDAVGDVFNVGAPNEIAMNALAQLVLDRSGSSSRIVHIPYEEAYAEGFEDVERRIPDIGKIGRVVGWQPKLDLDRIVTDVIASDRRALESIDASSTPNAR